MTLLTIIRSILSAIAIAGLYGLYKLDPGAATLADVLGLLHNEALQGIAANLTLIFLTIEVVIPYLSGTRQGGCIKESRQTRGVVAPSAAEMP